MKINEIEAELKKDKISEALEYHSEHNIPLYECVFRYGSKKFLEFYNHLRDTNADVDSVTRELLETDLGLLAHYKGELVPLDLPFEELITEEKDVQLNKPKRGGPKKFYVYVKDGDKVKKVTFGDTTGLKAKINDPKARKAFAARHNCDKANDKTKASYWSCRLPRYAKQLGLSGGGNFFW